MKVWIECCILRLKLNQHYKGKLTIGSCESQFQIYVDNDLFHKHSRELLGKAATDVDIGLLRRVWNIIIIRDGKVIDFSDKTYVFISGLLFAYKDALDGMPEKGGGKSFAIFEGEWDLGISVNEYLDPVAFPGSHMMVQ